MRFEEASRSLGIEFSLSGAGVLRKLCEGTLAVEDLSDKEIGEITAAWESRNYVPVNLLEKVDRVEKPDPEEVNREEKLIWTKQDEANYQKKIKLAEEQAEKKFVSNIVEYFKQLMQEGR